MFSNPKFYSFTLQSIFKASSFHFIFFCLKTEIYLQILDGKSSINKDLLNAKSQNSGSNNLRMLHAWITLLCINWCNENLFPNPSLPVRPPLENESIVLNCCRTTTIQAHNRFISILLENYKFYLKSTHMPLFDWNRPLPVQLYYNHIIHFVHIESL